MSRLIFLLWIIYNLYSCAGSRAFPEEVVLFPNRTEEKWWLWNSITEDIDGEEIHLCALVSFKPVSGKYFVSCFFSVWTESKGFYHGLHSTELEVNDFKLKFPLVLDIPGKDSISGEWYLYLGRGTLGFYSEILDQETGFSFPLTIREKFEKQSPFLLTEMISYPGIWASPPLPAEIKIQGEIRTKAQGISCLRVFVNRGSLLEKSKETSVTWLDLYLNNGKQFGILFSTDPDGKVQILGESGRDAEANLLPPSGIALEADKSWESGISGKSYPLGFTITLATEKSALLLKPRIPDQEIAAGKSSFWMGAITLEDHETGMVIGSGNMYVLNY